MISSGPDTHEEVRGSAVFVPLVFLGDFGDFGVLGVLEVVSFFSREGVVAITHDSSMARRSIVCSVDMARTCQPRVELRIS
jgi:hypothetical protein